MSCRTATRWVLRGLASAWGLVLAAPPASAFEFVDGRLQVHGFYEAQIRSLVRDFDMGDDWDLAQWWNILNLEIEADIAPDGFGPFDALSAFARIEVRYDCVYRRACGIFPSANTYGDRPKKLPARLGDGRRSGFTGTIFTGNLKRFNTNPFDKQSFDDRYFPDDSRNAAKAFNSDTFSPFFRYQGPLGISGELDPLDPAPFYFSRFFNLQDGVNHCRWAHQKIEGPTDGHGTREMAPIDFACKLRPIGPMADKPNPFRAGDINPLTGQGGIAELPFRPAPSKAFNGRADLDTGIAKGVWIPNKGLQRLLREETLDNIDQNFRLDEIAWNRGASQQDEKELKELYLDMEFLDSRLFVRLGRQTIIWGKTELFAIDPFNPRDLALASLPTLEESRIGLWALRAIFSLYEIGPLEDVRVEAALNLDDFEPNDFGRCGEGYTPLAACAITFGNFVHGYTGLGLVGADKPPDPWNSPKGLQGGARVEFRYDRFSFAVTDYYGYTHSFFTEQVFRYSRNVDPETGRPRHTTADESCVTGRESACLQPGDSALRNHSVNQQLFHMICATSIGFNDLDPSACGQSLFNSLQPASDAALAPTVVLALNNGLAGDLTRQIFGGLGDLAGFNSPATQAQILANHVDPFYSTNFSAVPGNATVLVPLSRDGAGDGVAVTAAEFPPGAPGGVVLFAPTGIQRFLTDQQEALLGCGRFYGTLCDLNGLDLMNLEFSAIAQSWPGIEGTLGRWDTRDRSVNQPGTQDFQGGPVCTRFFKGKVLMLPGCRGPGDEGYDPAVDGTITGGIGQLPNIPFLRRHPFTGQPFRSEMAVLSWNALMLLVAFSFPDEGQAPNEEQYDSTQPFRTDGCSFAKPQFCDAFQTLTALGRVQRNTLEAGGNGRFGRRDFVWQMGTPLIARWQKRNVLGFALDFAEDVTKTNWGVEFNWEEGLQYADADEVDSLSDADTLNLTVSVDRPTFINFLNQGRTFFFNSQWFFQYIPDYKESFQALGPWNVLATFTVQTGYHQDRLLPSFTLVYDLRSNSGAFLPQLTYRFTDAFSATFGVAGFWGRMVERDTFRSQIVGTNRVGRGAYHNFTEPALSVVRERDELFLRVKYTF